MEFYIEERQGVDVLVFETSCRPAADTEVSMWKKIKDLEQKLARFSEIEKAYPALSVTELMLTHDTLEKLQQKLSEALEVIRLISGHSANPCPVAQGFDEEACDCGCSACISFLKKHGTDNAAKASSRGQS